MEILDIRLEHPQLTGATPGEIRHGAVALVHSTALGDQPGGVCGCTAAASESMEEGKD